MTGPTILEKRSKWFGLNPASVADALDPSTKRVYVEKKRHIIDRGINILERVLEQGEFIFEDGKLKGFNLNLYSLYSKTLGEIEEIGEGNYYLGIKKRLIEIKEGLFRISQNPMNADRKDYDQAYRLFAKVSDNCMIELDKLQIN